MLALEHSEHGDNMHPALRVVDPRTGSIGREQIDEGMALYAAAWSPIPGDQRLAVVHERTGEERPAIWDLSTGTWTDLDLELRGPRRRGGLVARRVGIADRAQRRGSRPPVPVRAGGGSLQAIAHDEGSIWSAAVRPDGDVVVPARAASAPTVLGTSGDVVLHAGTERAPAGRPYVSWHFDNGEGDQVHGFYVTPEGEGRSPS